MTRLSLTQISPEELEILLVLHHRRVRNAKCQDPIESSIVKLAHLAGKMIDRGLLVPVPCKCSPKVAPHLVPSDLGLKVIQRKAAA